MSILCSEPQAGLNNSNQFTYDFNYLNNLQMPQKYIDFILLSGFIQDKMIRDGVCFYQLKRNTTKGN